MLMTDENPMEDKKLNFNQPFLSVRRRLPTTVTNSRISKEERKPHNPPQPVTHHHLPPHRSKLQSGPLKNAGAVPFLWEQTPGQPKSQDTIKPPTDKNTKITDTPPIIAPKLPPGRFSSNDKNIEKETKEESSDSGDSDDAYVDALDSLSRTESFYQNCSTSGLSGPGGYSFAKMPSADREFMMDRFLPAAKAMASETTTQYVVKKQHLVEEQSKWTKKTVKKLCKPELRYGPSFAKRYSDYLEKEDESDDDEEYDQSRNLPGVCGLLPRFCLSLLNPVPAMSVRTRVNNAQPRSSLAGSSCEKENEPRSVGRTELKLVDKIQTISELDDNMTKSRRNECAAGTKGFGSDSKGFEELSGGEEEISPNESNSASPVVEKTLYVDTIHKVNIAHELDAFSIFCSTEKPEKEATEGSLVNYNPRHYPVPPPLPKSPSDSWLGRTLPSMSNKNSSLRLYIGAQNELSKAHTSGDIKWETMVKTTRVQGRHMHNLEESLTAIPET